MAVTFLTNEDKAELLERMDALEQGGGSDSGQNAADKLVLKSPDGTVWNITVSDTGVITATRATEDGGEETVTFTIPVVNLTGDLTGISGDDYVNVVCHYLDSVNTVEFTDYAEIAYQGSSSMSFTNVEDGVDKAKNYKIKLYTDEARESKSKRVFKDWFATNNFHIKANYGDCTNFMNNMMMHYLTKSYQYLTPLPRDGARYTVDGFPVLLYINDVFCGIRFWNLKQDDKVYNLNEEETDESGNVTQEADLCYQIGLNNGSSKGDNSGAFIYGNLNSGSNAGLNFADAHAEIDYYWEDRVWDKTSDHPDVLYDTIQWVSEATDEEFVANLEQYFDKEYLINYFVMMYTCGMGDSICKNFNMLYFPDMGKWYATFWDMDFAFGCGWSLATVSYNMDVLASTYGASRLFTKLWANFKPEIVAKYRELRKTVLTVEQVEDSINAIWGAVTAEMIADNYSAKYNGTGNFKTNGANYIKGWATNRFAHMDNIMVDDTGGGTEEEPEEAVGYSAGYINDSGELTTHDRSYVSDNYEPVPGSIIYIVQPVSSVNIESVRIAEYDADKNFIKRSYDSEIIRLALNENTAYVRVGYTVATGGTPSVGELNALFAGYYLTTNVDKINIELGTVDATTGENADAADRCRSDYIAVSSGDVFTVLAGNNMVLRCYDSGKAFVGNIPSSSMNFPGMNATITEGIFYVRVLLVTSNADSCTLIDINGKIYDFTAT